MTTTNRGPGGRGAGLDRDQIIEAALTLMDRDGVDALTMRGLGRELGVKAQALYWHFSDSEALCAAVVDTLAAELVIDPPTDDPPRVQLAALLTTIREHWLRHPAAIRLSRSHLPSTMGAVDRGIGLIEAMGASRERAFDLYRALSLALVGFVKSEVGLARSIHHVKAGTTSRQYIVSLPSEAGMDERDHTLDTDAVFQQILTLLLDGIETELGEPT